MQKNSNKPELPNTPPEEFQKIIKDFISDILNTFPEYSEIISKWWKNTDYSYITDNCDRILNEEAEKMENMNFIFNYCLNFYPERFFDIIYQNEELFSINSIKTEFLPGLSFKELWNCNDITEKTRTTIWKYLQLILLSLIGCIKNKESFGEAVKLFEDVDETDFKNKLEQSMDKLNDIFNNLKNAPEIENGNSTETSKNMEGINIDGINLPSPDDVHKHISGMLNGKLGKLASEIADEVSGSFNLNMENVTDAKDIFQSLFSDPGKLMSLVKNVGDKLECKLKQGDINENELFSEATDIINKMKNIPCMDNIQSMLKQMGLNPDISGIMKMAKGEKDEIKEKEALDRTAKHKKFKQNIKHKLELKQMQKLLEETTKITTENYKPISDEELVTLFSNNNNDNENIDNVNENRSNKNNKKQKNKK